MKALLLAAGLGTRLRPLTDRIPKCLVPIRGKPLLDIWLENLYAAGIGPILVNTHYLAAVVEEHLLQSLHRSQVLTVYEPKLLGTAGTIRANAAFFAGDDGMVVHADNYCNFDFRKLLLAHETRPRNCAITMLTFRTATPQSCGIVELDSKGVITAFHEKVSNPPSDLANGAIYVFSREAIKWIQESDVSDLSTEVIPRFIGQIYSYECDGILEDIGTPQAYAKYS
jgi:mannose-1-phosphate guanylyltransferase